MGILTFFNIVSKSPVPILAPIPENQVVMGVFRNDTVVDEKVLAQAKIDLGKRWPAESVNNGFRDNILLSLCYLKLSQDDPNFEPKIDSPPRCLEDIPTGVLAEFELEPGGLFVFHKNILLKYGRVASEQRLDTSNQLPVSRIQKPIANYQLLATNYQTMGSGFVVDQGYKVVNGLGGNGVCHLASLINWAASEAGLQVEAPVDHGFAVVEGVPRKYWTSIKYQQAGKNSQRQNLYIINNKDFAVKFLFEKKGNDLTLKILKI